MKEIRTREAHIESKEYVNNVVCDICQKFVDWNDDSWDSNKVVVEAVLGSRYPEADCRQLYIIDICPSCFMEKVKPLIEKEFKTSFREISNDCRYEKHE